MTARPTAIAVLLALATGCYSATARECGSRCGSDGACPDDLVCGGDAFCHPPGSRNVCLPDGKLCRPATCASLGAQCGAPPDGCGAALDCGGCDLPMSCGGGGTPLRCACTATTCEAENRRCGALADGCGSTLACGECDDSERCGGGGVVGRCAVCDGQWKLSAIDITGTVGSYADLVVDDSGLEHVSFRDDTRHALLYAVRHAGAETFTTEVVDDRTDTGTYTSLAVGRDGSVHISYVDADGRLRYARRGATGWTREAILDEPDASEYQALALDTAGDVHVVAYKKGGGDLRYFHPLPTGGWAGEFVDRNSDVGLFPALAVDSAGILHVSYLDLGGFMVPSSLKYARRPPGGLWSPVFVDKMDVGAYSSIAVSGAGAVHISYFDSANGDLKVASREPGGVFVPVTVDSAGVAGGFTSLALGRDGSILVSHRAGLPALDLKLSRRSPSGEWSTEVVEAAGDVGAYSALALDGGGGIHIVHHDDNLGDLRHAFRCAR